MDAHDYFAEQQYQRRKTREEHPAGHFDRAGRFWPSQTEARECCRSIRRPSRAYPFSLMVHCRSRRHVRQIHQAPSGIVVLD